MLLLLIDVAFISPQEIERVWVVENTVTRLEIVTL